MKAFNVECPRLGGGYDSIMIGESHGKVKWEAQKALNDAGWPVDFTDIKVTRRPIFDSIAGKVDSYFPYDEEVGCRNMEPQGGQE